MTARVCKCGCRASLAFLRADAVWAHDACRKAYKAGRAPNSPARNRNGGRSSGPQMAYHKTLAHATKRFGPYMEAAFVEQVLTEALPEKQRRRLEAR